MNKCLCCNSAREPAWDSPFCENCGVDWKAIEQLDEIRSVNLYKSQLEELLLHDPDANHEKFLLDRRKKLKISFAVHQEIESKILSIARAAEALKAFKLEFNENLQDPYAGRHTLLQFQFTNQSSSEWFSEVKLFWDDQETGDDMDYHASNTGTVRPGLSSTLGATHVFARAGTKEVKNLEITVVTADGESAKFRAETFYVQIGDPNQRVHNSNINNTTISGRVVDATGVAANNVEPEKSDFPKWKNLSFTIVASSSEIAAPPTPIQITTPSQPMVAAEQSWPAPAALVSDQQTGVTSGAQSATSLPVKTGLNTSDMSLRDAVERMLELLLKFSSMASASSSKGVFLAMDFSLNLLEILHGETPDQEMDAIVGMVFENPAGVAKDDEEFVINFQDAASVITLSGITIVGKDGNTVVGHASYEWGQMAANEWGLYRQRFGPGSYLISIGDQSANQNFSGLRFDLRRYKGPESVDALYAEAEAVLQRIFDTATPYTAEDDEDDTDDGDMDAESDVEDNVPAGAQNLAEDTDEDEEEYEEDDEDALDPEAEAARVQAAQRFTEREKRLGNFIKLYAFAAQQCDEAAPRSVFAARAMTPELWTAIHSGNGMTAVCMEPGQALLAPDGKLAGWNGAATALSGHGIYHMVSAGDGTYSMDGSSCFLSWEKFFFEIKADLVIRDAGPDLWLGTADKFLIRGSYCDYSGNIPQWDYFEDFAKKGLLDAFASFKQSI
jgi:hypothetical protein